MKKALKMILTEIAKKNLLFRKILRKTMYIMKKIRYKIRGIGKGLDEDLIVFCSFNGRNYSDSPKAIYEYMKNNDKYKKYRFVLGFVNPNKYKFLENERTIVLKNTSSEYEKKLSKAKYWIFNYKIPDYLYPRKNQVFIQCWHGTPLKRLGYDLEHFDNLLNTIEGMKKRYKLEAKKMNYLISPSRFASEKFTSAWNLKEFNKEKIIVEKGYPRNDFLFNYTAEDVIKIKKKLHIENTNKKVILYAPTYRSNQHKSGEGYIYKEEVNFEKIKKDLGQDYIILFRPHYFIANEFDFEKYNGFVYNVCDIDDINELYIISDILITDYSSVFFDFANLKKPIVFYMYDLEHYRDKSNGFYIELSELPGNITKTDEELIDEIKRVTNEFEYDEKYKRFNEKYNYLDDGNASKRVVEFVIK